jgi:hypothetical protein
MPTILGTLDSIHLASALEIREATDVPVALMFATHDEQLARGARAFGFQVIGCGRRKLRACVDPQAQGQAFA